MLAVNNYQHSEGHMRTLLIALLTLGIIAGCAAETQKGRGGGLASTGRPTTEMPKPAN
jgi:hypothetical protein